MPYPAFGMMLRAWTQGQRPGARLGAKGHGTQDAWGRSRGADPGHLHGGQFAGKLVLGGVGEPPTLQMWPCGFQVLPEGWLHPGVSLGKGPSLETFLVRTGPTHPRGLSGLT